MSHRGISLLAASLALSAGILALPTQGLASSGGGGLSPSGGVQGSPSPSQPSPSTQPGNTTVSASGDGMTIATNASGFLSNQLTFSGSVPAGDSGEVIEIERLGNETGGAWAPTAHATVAPNGSFTVVWRANHIGRFAIRAVVETSATRTPASSPSLTVTVYRRAIATQYGPGFYGHKTACGETLRRGTIGVANRTLKCGTQVAVYYQGRTITVPVIDRGPYANGADWDLTTATARALGIGGTATVGAVSLPTQG